MAPRGKRAELLRWIERVQPTLIGEAEWDELARELNPVSTGYLRRLLRDSGVPLAPLIEGVRQENFEALETSLLKLLEEYQRRDPARRASIRRLVIDAKDHARWAAKKPEKRAEKDEMALWMLTWLENPPLFPQWVQLRRRM
jgi:hypothetical protein